ncbi:MAG TPA: hypothetical protein V6D28_13995 [Leptolyngbyaceae cyanobacterium]
MDAVSEGGDQIWYYTPLPDKFGKVDNFVKKVKLFVALPESDRTFLVIISTLRVSAANN